MANEYVNKVEYGGRTLLDLTQDTATAADVAQGKYFHLATGQRVQGTATVSVYTATITGNGDRYGRYVQYDSTKYYTNGDSFVIEGGEDLYIRVEASVTNIASIYVNDEIVAQRTDGGTATYTYTLPEGDITVNVGTVGVIRVDAENAIKLQDKTISVTPAATAQTQTVTADAGYDGLDEVTINTAAMPAGSAGRPTATKGAVSNHSITITPSVTNTTGYITGSTRTGTAVTVTAAELASGTKSITANGSGIDVVGYESVDVAVPGGVTPTGNINITQAGVTDVTNYATATVAAGSLYSVLPIENDTIDISVDDNGEVTAQLIVLSGHTITPVRTDGWLSSSASTELVIQEYGSYQIPTAGFWTGVDGEFFDNNYGVRMWKATPFTEVDKSQGDTPGFLPEGHWDGEEPLIYPVVPSGTTITPTESAQTIGGANYMMEGAVTVNAIPSNYVGSGVARNDSTDLAASGATVTAPAGYYANSASKSVASGTEGTPTATKSAVSNHSVTVTPSVTNAAGYISGGTKTGTAVSVSASELVSGSQTVTENGTVDVTNLAEVVVAVSGGGGGMQVATKTITLDSASASISFSGLSGEPTSFAITTAADLATGASPWKTAAVTYDGTNLNGQIVTNTSNAQASHSTSFSKSYSNGTLTVTGTGTNFQANQYKLVYTYGGNSANLGTDDVQVGSGATSISFTGLTAEPDYFSLVFTSNFSTSSGYQRVMAVVYDGNSTYGVAMDSGAKALSSWSYTYSNGTLTISSQGTNNGGYFHQPGDYHLTYGIGGTVEPTVIEVEPLSVTQNGTYTAPDGVAYSPVTVNVSGGGALTVATKTATMSAVGQTLSFTGLLGTPKYWFVKTTSQISSSGSTTYYYLTDAFYNGTSVIGNSFRIGSTRRIYSWTSGVTQSYSNGTLTITGGSATGSSPGQWYNGSYELTYIY